MKPLSPLPSTRIPLDSLNQLTATTTTITTTTLNTSSQLAEKQLQIVLKPQLTYAHITPADRDNTLSLNKNTPKKFDCTNKVSNSHLDASDGISEMMSDHKEVVEKAGAKALNVNDKRKLSIILDGKLSDIGVTNLPTFGKCRFKKESNLVRLFLQYLLPFGRSNTIQYNTIQYNTIQYNTIQYKYEYYYSGIKPVEFRVIMCLII